MPAATTKRFPFETFPTGWFAVGLSSELSRGDVKSLRYFGEDLVLFRTETGAASLVGAYCPHLGAHMGDGSVCGEHLRCPFHGFEFDGTGRCVKTAYGTRPPQKAQVASWLVEEVNGVIFTWFDAAGRAPLWPLRRLDDEGYTDFRFQRAELESHPQETSENSVDFGHFTIVHNFGRAWSTKEVETDGPILTAGYGITREFKVPGKTFSLEALFDVFVDGLGYSLVTGGAPALGMTMRNLVLATPTDEGKMHLWMGSSINQRGSRLATHALHRFTTWALCTEVLTDVPIWTKKRYVEKPMLAQGDGPIAVYRRWCKQFYPEQRVRLQQAV